MVSPTIERSTNQLPVLFGGAEPSMAAVLAAAAR